MILGRVNCVNSDDIGFERNKIRDIGLAALGVGQRINEARICRCRAGCASLLLIRNTLEEELSSVRKEEFGALYYWKQGVSC